jgi:hypothetical protein
MRIAAGADWKLELQNALQHARTAILLISADFLASDFIVSDELPKLLDAAQKHGTLILPIIVKPSRFARDPMLNRFQSVNRPEAPLISLPEGERERIFDKVAELCEGMTRRSSANLERRPWRCQESPLTARCALGHGRQDLHRRAKTSGRKTHVDPVSAEHGHSAASYEGRRDRQRPARPPARRRLHVRR